MFRNVLLLLIAVPAVLGWAADEFSPEAIARFGVGGMLHSGAVQDVAYSPDGKTAASCSKDGSVCLWDLASGKVKKRWREHFEGVKPLSLAFSPDGATLAVGDFSGKTHLFEMPGGKEVRVLPLENTPVHALSYSPDGKVLAAGCGDAKIRLWKGPADQPLELIGHQYDVVSIAFSHDGKLLASGGIDQIARIWDVATGKQVRAITLHSDTVTAVRFSPDGTLLATASRDKTVRFWRVSDGDEVRRLDDTFPKMVFALAFSPDGKTIVTGNESVMVDLWNVESGRRLASFGQHWSSVNAVEIAPDGKTLLSGGSDGRVRLWDVATGKKHGREDGHSEEVLAVEFSPDGSMVATAGKDEHVRLWSAKDGKFIKRLDQDWQWIHTLKFSPDGKTIVTGTRNGNSGIFDIATGKRTGVLMPTHVSQYLAITWLADGKRIAGVGLKDTVDIWDVGEKKQTGTFRIGHENYAVALAPGGKLLAVSGADPSVRLFDVSTGSLVFTYTGSERTTRAIAYSPDGCWLAAGCDDHKVYVWEVASGALTAKLEMHTAPVNALTFVDNNRIASGSKDSEVFLWDLISGKECHVLHGHRAGVNALAYDRASKRLVSGGDDLAAVLWNVPAADAVEAQKLGEEELEKLWTELASKTGTEVLDAIRKLVAGENASVAFLKTKLQADVLDDVRKLVINLDHDDFETRERSFEALATLHAIAHESLKQAANSDSAEVSLSAKRLLKRLEGSLVLTPGAALARLRAMQALGAIGTAEARAVLEQIQKSGLSEQEKSRARSLLEK